MDTCKKMLQKWRPNNGKTARKTARKIFLEKMEGKSLKKAFLLRVMGARVFSPPFNRENLSLELES